MTASDNGPSLSTYLETRLNLMNEQIKEALAESDKRYEQRWAASQKALESALIAQKESITTAMAAADRAVTKAELATEKRFESVNEFRGTLDNQQRTLIPRSEVDVMVKGLNDKIGQLTKQFDQMQAERQGVKGGYGYAIGVVGVLLSLMAIVGYVMTMIRLKG
jgi:hypothetical protein